MRFTEQRMGTEQSSAQTEALFWASQNAWDIKWQMQTVVTEGAGHRGSSYYLLSALVKLLIINRKAFGAGLWGEVEVSIHLTKNENAVQL